MTSHLSLLTTIDRLIQRIDKVKVFQEHLKLITTSLIRIQHILNETHELHDIEQTLIVIDVIVASCSEKEVDLNGVTYRDLQSLLFRFQIRLAQHQADLTDDYQTKIQIFSSVYREQQILVRKVFDETMQQRMEIIEQNTKENIAEKLHLLRAKHFDTIKHYLHRCTELHKSVPLTGLTGDIVAKVAHMFYQLSSKDKTQLEFKWQSCDLPLTRTFIQFKPDKSTSFERNESRKLLMKSEDHVLRGPHSRQETSRGIWERLVSAPYMMSMVERDRYEQEEDVSEETIIRTKRWIVILGDPGSGKTSFARWLVRHLAQTLLLNGQHSTDYGPLRIPILIRVGEFAEMLKQQSSLTLFDYIGKHKWMGKSIVDDSSISADNLSHALQDYIRHGQALVILDGLDEIPVSDQRSLIISTVENFVDTYVQTPTGASVFDNTYLSRLLDDPSRSGGNQLIVTSRIVGYHAAPLAGQFAHYTIRPMDMEHMKDFVDYWFFRVHQQILDALDLTINNQGENHAQALKEELGKKENNGLLDVASNSCLMSFVCSVAFTQSEKGSPLPTQRICLYEAIVNSMLALWSSKRSTIPVPDLIRILSDIATYIHGKSASGLIHEEKMKEICMQSIKDSSNRSFLIQGDVETIENQADEFVRIIREDVGILAARGESLYGFLHLTFQEYFTCLKLIQVDHIEQEKLMTSECISENKVQLVAQSLRRHANNPRFRVPTALALGKISLSWSQKDFDRFCLEFIREEYESSCLLPLGAYMLISYGNDLVHYPSHDVLFIALDGLMIAAGQHRWSVVCPFLFDHIIASLRKLRRDIVSPWIDNLLSRSPSHDTQTISALCHLLEGKSHEFGSIKWLNQSSCSALQLLSIRDNETNEFAIDRLLVKIAFSNHRLLPVNSTTFKGFLITEEIELDSIPMALFPLIITLYGGLKRDDETVVFDPFYIYRESTALTPILVRLLSRSNHHWHKDQNIIMLKEECLRALLTRIKNQDESCETVDLLIATICLYGIDYVRQNVKIDSTSLIHLSMSRLKYISMTVRQFYATGGAYNIRDTKKVTAFISSAIENFQWVDSPQAQFLDLVNSFRTSMARLQSSATSVLFEQRSDLQDRLAIHLPNSLRKENNFLNALLMSDIRFYPHQQSCSLIHYFTKLFWILEHNDEYDTQYRMAVAMDTIPGYLLFRNDEDIIFPLTFVPTHLQNIYLQLFKKGLVMVDSKTSIADSRQCLWYGHILLECLMFISNASCKRLSALAALIALLPRLRIHQLENFASSLLWILATKESGNLNAFETVRKEPMNYDVGLYINKIEEIMPGENMKGEERQRLIEKCIKQEYERFRDAFAENDETSTKMYSACISLTRVCRWGHYTERLHFLEQCVQGAMSIKNKLVRLDALSMIAFYCHSDYNQIQVNQERSLQDEIEYQLISEIDPDLPLLLHTVIFIRCLPLLRQRQTVEKCLQSLFSKFFHAEQDDQQVFNEALAPYLKSIFGCSSSLEILLNTYRNHNQTITDKSSVLKEYLNRNSIDNLSSSLLISNLYLVELASDLQKSVADDDLRSLISQLPSSMNDRTSISKPFQLEYSILTTTQVLTITNILAYVSSSNCSQKSKQVCIDLNKTLHRFNSVEFKACRLLESWMVWKDSSELSSFAYHAALLLVNSDFCSAEAATIVCDLLRSEDDRFRHRTEMILRTKNDDNDIRTSSKLGLDVLLTFVHKKAYCIYTSISASLTLARMFESLIIDIPSHLHALLWLERYRIHKLINKDYVLNNTPFLSISSMVIYLLSDVTKNVSICDNICRISNDLVQYMCDLIGSNFSAFVSIADDTTSDAVLESHNQFVVSVLVNVPILFANIDETDSLMVNTLTMALKTSINNEISRALVYALGYICNEKTYKILFNIIQMTLNNESDDTTKYSDYVLAALITSYCYCISVKHLLFDDDDIDLFCKLCGHSSQNIVRAAHIGLGRVLKNDSRLFEILNSDHIQCYHALIGSTAFLFVNTVSQKSTETAAEFIEQHPDLLSIFVVELYNSIRHFSNIVENIRTKKFLLAYGYPQYVEIASLVAVRMPAAFCAFIEGWPDGENFKRALFYTSKQHNYSQRAACLIVLSIFGELTSELCEMIMEGLHDDPYIQNTCYSCLIRINFISDEKIILNLLFSYLKSKSMNVRYAAVKMLLHLSRSSLIPSVQIQTVLNDLILDSSLNEELWLIEEQDTAQAEPRYYYAGLLRDVVYSLLVQYLTGDVRAVARRNELNHIDLDFIESEKASRIASCLYEQKTDDNLQLEQPMKTKSVE